MAQEILADIQGIHAEVIDHSEEFITLVHQSALSVYHDLVSSQPVRRQLAGSNNFNFGKVYAYAEFMVFRKEFQRRFPAATRASCINTFSALLLKNDISISNLVDYMEQSLGPEIELLARK